MREELNKMIQRRKNVARCKHTFRKRKVYELDVGVRVRKVCSKCGTER